MKKYKQSHVNWLQEVLVDDTSEIPLVGGGGKKQKYLKKAVKSAHIALFAVSELLQEIMQSLQVKKVFFDILYGIAHCVYSMVAPNLARTPPTGAAAGTEGEEGGSSGEGWTRGRGPPWGRGWEGSWGE